MTIGARVKSSVFEIFARTTGPVNNLLTLLPRRNDAGKLNEIVAWA